MKIFKPTTILFIILLTPLSHLSAQRTSASWGTKINKGKLKIGGRIQGAASLEELEQDLYLRRLRVNMVYQPWEKHKIVYDIRNDNSNQEDRGDGSFQIGDAYWQINSHLPFIDHIRLFRAKVDVSYSQTSSSKHLLNPNRTRVSEKASDYVVHNRRATNAQINGGSKNLRYHLIISDGVHSEDLNDMSDREVTDLTQQKFTYGGKIRYHFIDQNNDYSIQDTFYGRKKRFSLGLGQFQNDHIKITNDASDLNRFHFARSLTNLEIDFSYDYFRFLAEAFLFNGDLIDLTEKEKSRIIGASSGHYWLTEFVIHQQYAIYFSYEQSVVDEGETDALEHGYTIGMNFYQNMDAIRYGFSFTDYDRGDRFTEGRYDRELNLNIMLNF